MEITDELMNRTDVLREDMHHLIEQIKKTCSHNKFSYNDSVTTFLLMKIAELEIKLENRDKS